MTIILDLRAGLKHMEKETVTDKKIFKIINFLLSELPLGRTLPRVSKMLPDRVMFDFFWLNIYSNKLRFHKFDSSLFSRKEKNVGSDILGPFADYFEDSSIVLDGHFWKISRTFPKKVGRSKYF